MSSVTVPIPITASAVTELAPGWGSTAEQTCVSFLNTFGGTLYLGLSRNGSLLGVSRPQDVQSAVHRFFHDGIVPACPNLCRTEILSVKDKSFVSVHIAEGAHPPYAIAAEPDSGQTAVYVRTYNENQKADSEILRQLYRKGDPTPDELITSHEQSLTFSSLSQCFSAVGAPFSKDRFAALGLVNSLGFFSRLGFWLSDQCNVETRIGFFLGNDKASQPENFHTVRGSLAEQYHRILQLLNKRYADCPVAQPCGNRHGKDAPYPELAVREALLHLFAYRDFNRSGQQAFVSSFADHLEMLSFGGLLSGCTPEHLREGLANPRNPRLTDILITLAGLDTYGLSLPVIESTYHTFGLTPELNCSPIFLRLRLPKISEKLPDLTPREKSIVDFLKSTPNQSSKTVQNFLGLGFTTTFTTLQSLLEKKVLIRTGTGRNTRYRLRETP